MDQEVDSLDFDFKPITDGLGFHQEKKAPGNLKKEAANNNFLVKSTLKKVYTQYKDEFPVNQLDQFYKQEEVKEKLEVKEKVVVKQEVVKEIRKTGLFLSFFSYLADQVVALLLTSVFSIGVWLTLELNGINSKLFFKEIGMMVIIFHSFTFFLYMYLSDTVGERSFGKKFFGLKLVNLNGERPLAKQVFIREFIKFSSLITLGLICIVDFHGKLSDTRLIENES